MGLTTLAYDASGNRAAESSYGSGSYFRDGATAYEMALTPNGQALVTVGVIPGDEGDRVWTVAGYLARGLVHRR